MTVHIYRIERSSYSGRLRARVVSSKIEELAAEARKTGQPNMRCAHGGAVCNSYGYPAQTEAIVEVVFPPRADGIRLAIQYLAHAVANKVTLGGAACAAAGKCARPIWDNRYGEAARLAARRALVRRARADIGFRAGGEAAARKRAERGERARLIERELVLVERLLQRRACRLYGSDPLDTHRAIARGKLRQSGPWLAWTRDDHVEVRYVPHDDARDLDALRSETNQERRRRIYEACGDRVLDSSALTLIDEDRYGRLYDTGIATGSWHDTFRLVRVVCPSTGAVYLLQCDPRARTAHEAVASTFGLRAEEYHPTAQT